MTEREKSRAMLSTAALNIESYRIVARKSGNAIAEPRSSWFLVDDSHDTSPALSDFCFAARGAGGNSCQRSAESVGSRTTVLIDSHGFSVVHIVVPRVLVHVVLLVLIFCTILNDLNKWKKWKNQVNQVKGAGKFWDSVRIGEERVQAFELERMPTLAWQFRICDVQLPAMLVVTTRLVWNIVAWLRHILDYDDSGWVSLPSLDLGGGCLFSISSRANGVNRLWRTVVAMNRGLPDLQGITAAVAFALDVMQAICPLPCP